MARLVGVLLGALLFPAAGAAADAEPPQLAADAATTGYIRLLGFGPPGTHVDASERIGRRHLALASGTVGGDGVFYAPRATRWRCDRVVRRFESVTVDPQGREARQRFTLRTPSCRRRIALHAPRRVAPGRRFTVRVTDRWRIGGIRARLCVDDRCRPLTIQRSQTFVRPSLRVLRRGIARVAVRVGRFVTESRAGVGVTAPRRPRPRLVLATGDSTIQGVESVLGDRLPSPAVVARRYFVGTGITRPITPWWPDWPTLAQRLARERVPRLTVISLGANDAYPLTPPGGDPVACCGRAWTDEYVRRQRRIIAAFARGGEGRVLWLTLPAPRDPDHRRVTAAVNAATRRAVRGRTSVRLVRVDRLITPGFRFRPRIRDRGRLVRVRLPDGIHLNARGTDIVARAVVAAARRWRGTL